ncbi:MAG: OB-fold nucleic acid binding domain-containing protein [Gemmataceae bacterium]
MPRQFVAQLADGDNVEETFLVSDKQLRANRNGNLYIQVDLRDRTGVINGRQWNAGEHLFRSFEAGDFLAVRGKVQLFQGALQLILSHLERVETEKVELTEFLPHTEQDVGKLLTKLKDALRKLGDPHLRALCDCFLMDDEFVRNFSQCPAGVRNHHAYVGGLLEHVVNLLDGAEKLLPLYPGVDPDLAKVGIFLHDAGKVRELSYRRSFAYTDEGQLLGHITIGVELVNEKVRQVPALTGEPFPRELLLRIKHMILSHHGTLEFGSPVLPMTPEAIFLSTLDNLDAKVHTFTRDIREDRNATSAWTPFTPALQRRLFKGFPAGDAPVGLPPDGVD